MTSTTNCRRCGKLCRIGPPGNPDARILRRAKKGMCVECCIVDFFQRLDNESGGHLLRGIRGPDTPAVALRLPHVQRLFESIMRAGNSDATPDEIDWERVIEVWCIAPLAKGTLA